MNLSTYIIIEVVLIFAFLLFIANDCEVLTVISAGSFVLLLIVGAICPIGHTLDFYEDATSTKIGNEIVVQSKSYPTQIVTDIKYIDQPLQIHKQIDQNVWGGDMMTRHIVEIKPPAEESLKH